MIQMCRREFQGMAPDAQDEPWDNCRFMVHTASLHHAKVGELLHRQVKSKKSNTVYNMEIEKISY